LRRRLALLVSVGMALALMGAPPVSSAVVVKGVACSAYPLNFKWMPKITTVAKGTKVTWKAVSGSHTVTATSKNWSKKTTISQGQTTAFTFKTAGTYRFRCTFHSTVSNGTCSGMCGKVVVG
jgi:plastocyanin